MKLGARIFGALAGLLLLYLAVGLILPGSWEARTQAHLDALPETVFPYLSQVREWTRWNQVPESGVETFGPGRGQGAGFRWDDPRYGQGEMRFLSSDPPRSLTYRVSVEEGDLVIHGTLTLGEQDGGTRLLWVEEGDFGWNPLLGYAARGMADSQTRAMEESLNALRALLSKGKGEEGLNPP